ncbi:hypothetical protein BV25DRAFT_1282683 [Artomyces pyxidatus]|uniref:Uncharacterized protein n=1 Tax=Artomyces pyxidatus TaxID=48021 RepID=A0ACB8SRH1_9AGAM|nr:hypothetical protein BV25DRAFT_1282683 [Artomyces pyxidatus]
MPPTKSSRTALSRHSAFLAMSSTPYQSRQTPRSDSRDDTSTPSPKKRRQPLQDLNAQPSTPSSSRRPAHTRTDAALSPRRAPASPTKQRKQGDDGVFPPISRPRLLSQQLHPSPTRTPRTKPQSSCGEPGPFYLLEEVQKGGYSSAYAVRDEATGRVLCLKSVKKQMVVEHDHYRRAIMREIEAYQRVAMCGESPYVMQLHAVFQTEETVYFAMVRRHAAACRVLLNFCLWIFVGV